MLNLKSFVVLTICYFAALVLADDVKFNYTFERFEIHPDDDFLKYKFDVLKTGDSTFKVQGTLEHKATSEDMEFEITSFHSDEKNGEMIETKYKTRKNICDFLNGPYKTFIYPKFKDTSNIPTPETCPLPAEKYTVNETEMDVNRFKAFLKKGYWKIVMKLFKGDEIISSTAIHGSLTEIQ